MYRYVLSAWALPIAALCAASLSTLTSAQSAARPDPAEAGRPAPAVEYQSAFSGYQPFREQKGNVWKEVNKDVAENPGMGPMGSMKGMSGKSMAGMDDKSQKGDMAGMAGHDAMPLPKSPASAAGKGMAGMGDTGGKGALAGMADHGAMAMAKPQASDAAEKAAGKPTGPVIGTGVIQQIDKANGKVKMTHEPIDALGWPRMTMFFRLKDGALADQIKEGDTITFSLEKAASGYVISGFGRPAGGQGAAKPPMDHDMGKGEKK